MTFLLTFALLVTGGFSVSTRADASKSLLLRKPHNQRTAPIFIFHVDEFWLNLHHFLYVLGRAENKTRDSSREAVVNAPADQEQGLKKLDAAQQASWRKAVSAYAKDMSKKDAVFDNSMAALTNTLAKVANNKSPAVAGVDAAAAEILTEAAPSYRKIWWSSHRHANEVARSAMQKLVNQHGAAVLSFITKAYQLSWPEAGYDVHVSAYSNWAGAYSTDNNLLVVASLAEGNRGPYGLESVFHEAMHQWDAPMDKALEQLAVNLKREVPRNLSHTLIFFTAGEAVHRVFPDHVPYAEKFGVWARGWTEQKAALEEIWKPYLDGKGTRDEALTDLIKRLTPSIRF